jgi:hypothetical protein
MIIKRPEIVAAWWRDRSSMERRSLSFSTCSLIWQLAFQGYGDKESSCRRAAEWLKFVEGSIGSVEPDRTFRQMRDLGCELS